MEGSQDPAARPTPRLLPHVVSAHARDNPHKIWGSIPRSATDASLGYEDITFARLNFAISRAVSWVIEHIEPQRTMRFEPLAYMAPPDARYIIFAIAAIKAGFQMLFLSPRNSDEAQQSVIEEANCTKFVFSASMEARITKLLRNRPRLSKMACYVVPEQEDLLKDEFICDFPYEKTIEEARLDPLVALHTSSTTGIPKTIHLNQGYGLHEDVVQSVPKFQGLDIITRKPFYGNCRMFVAMPLFHAGGVLLTLLKSIYHDIISVFQPPSATLNAEVFDAILRYGNCTGCVIPPYLLEDMLAVPDYFDTLANLKFVQFGSGPLSKAAGDLLLTRQNDCPHYIGSSECGLFLLLELDNPVEDWQYFRFHPWSGVDMRPLDGDSETCEMFIVRPDGPKIPGLQPVFELFPELYEWPTKDLYVRHPAKPDHWRCIGRNDDVLVLSNGEKLNPVDTESRITNSHASVSGALVIGQGQFAPGLLLEVRETDIRDPSNRTELIEELWPSIQEANKAAAGHAQLDKALILFTSPSKPFLRTPKLSVRRKPTIDSYATEIDNMYRQYMEDTEGSYGDDANPVNLSFVKGIQKFLVHAIEGVTGWELAPGLFDDLFMYGMDSLQVVRIHRALRQAFAKQSAKVDFTAHMIYRHPTIDSLSKAIFRLINETGCDAGSSDATLSRGKAIESLITKYSTFDFPSTPEGRMQEISNMVLEDQMNIILTGSTGSLGNYILASLLSNTRVAHVYCLNRSKDARDRQLSNMATQGVDLSTCPDLDERVHFLHTDSLGAPLLGLDDAVSYDSLQRSGVTHIIHNAWPVNFNLTLTSFDLHIAGVRALTHFSFNLPKKPQIIFISSLSSVTNLSLREEVPEAIVYDHSAPAHSGYGESKYVAERVLSNAAETSHGLLSTSILRVGQIAGPVKSTAATWPTREWFPSLVISSMSVGALPASLGRMNNVDWVPVDLLADCITELLDGGQTSEENANGGPSSMQSKVYHILNPKPISWAELLPTVAAQIQVERTVSLEAWIELVREGPDESSVQQPNPARKILPFYEALTMEAEMDADAESHSNGETNMPPTGSKRFEAVKMAEKSNTFRDMGPVTKEWMSRWVTDWIS